MKEKLFPQFLMVIVVIILGITGCASGPSVVKFQDNYTPLPDTKVEVGSVDNSSGKTFDIDIEKMLADAISKELQDRELLWTENNEGTKLVINTTIVEYEKGNAFKRWVMPGWGSTILAIQCDLKNDDHLVGSANAKHVISFGGGFTIGAWKTVFSDIAKRVVGDLEAEIQKQ